MQLLLLHAIRNKKKLLLQVIHLNTNILFSITEKFKYKFMNLNEVNYNLKLKY